MEKIKPKVSVIVPVYNVEKYLHRCIDSILSQTFTDFELLLIDDGSKDASGIICDKYAQKDSRVQVFHKKNGGVSSARNTGLDNAQGDYIVFCDSDDWIEPTMYEELYNKAVVDNADIVYCNIKMIFSNYDNIYNAAEFSLERKVLIGNYITSIWTCLVNMIVKRELYENNNLKSPVHLCYCEDFWLSIRLFYFAKTISYINKAFYNYNRTNESSAMHNQNKKSERDEQTAYLETIAFFSKQGCINNYERELSWRILKSKQELVLDNNRFDEFLEIYPVSHKYVWSCPYINKKLKFMMWLLVHNMRGILNLIVKTRYIFGR